MIFRFKDLDADEKAYLVVLAVLFLLMLIGFYNIDLDEKCYDAKLLFEFNGEQVTCNADYYRGEYYCKDDKYANVVNAKIIEKDYCISNSGR
jgi:hypothetical protein